MPPRPVASGQSSRTARAIRVVGAPWSCRLLPASAPVPFRACPMRGPRPPILRRLPRRRQAARDNREPPASRAKTGEQERWISPHADACPGDGHAASWDVETGRARRPGPGVRAIGIVRRSPSAVPWPSGPRAVAPAGTDRLRPCLEPKMRAEERARNAGHCRSGQSVGRTSSASGRHRPDAQGTVSRRRERSATGPCADPHALSWSANPRGNFDARGHDSGRSRLQVLCGDDRVRRRPLPPGRMTPPGSAICWRSPRVVITRSGRAGARDLVACSGRAAMGAVVRVPGRRPDQWWSACVLSW